MKSILDYPPQAHLRRSRLYEALAPLSITHGEVDALIRAGVIVAKHILHQPRRRAQKKKVKKGPNVSAGTVAATLIKGRGYHVADDVIAALKLKTTPQ